MRKFYRVFKWIGLGLVSLVLLIYMGLSLFLYIEEERNARKFEPGDPVYFESNEPQEVVLLDSGLVSLKKRLQLIRQATKSIELEFFIYNVDMSSRLITQELIRKADEGVKVRILVDFSVAVLQLKPVYAEFLKSHGVDVKYYNTSPLYRLMSVQHRSHRKMLIVDDEWALTGGRNIADEYFDLSKKYNFLDSDLLIKGTIAQKMRESFDYYYNSKLAIAPSDLDYEVTSKEPKGVAHFIEDQSGLDELRVKIESLAPKETIHICEDSLFVTDYPGVGASQRRVYSSIVSELESAKVEVLAESPYFVLKGDGVSAITDITSRKVDLKILTNSLYSTDAYYTVAHMYPRLNSLSKTGVSLYVYSGKSLTGSNSERWGIHSKRAVVDRKTVLIGTYNIDPRSANLNSELMYVCRGNEGFAKEVQSSIENRMSLSRKLISEGKSQGSEVLTQGATASQKFWFFVTMPIANLFAFLL